MHLIITGATGLIGAAVLHHLVDDAIPSGQVSKVTILARRPIQYLDVNTHDKITFLNHSDFDSYPPELLDQLRGADGCIWSIGVSQSAVDAEEYTRITIDYAVEAAKAFAALSTKFSFVYISSDGATQTPGLLTMPFRRVKGIAEAALLALSGNPNYSSLRVFSVRPGGVDTKNDGKTLNVYMNHRSRGPSPVMEKVLFPFFRNIYPSVLTPSAELAKVLVDIARGDGEPLKGDEVEGGGRFVTNKAILRIIKENADQAA